MNQLFLYLVGILTGFSFGALALIYAIWWRITRWIDHLVKTLDVKIPRNIKQSEQHEHNTNEPETR